jgi:hypothetical protein
VHADDLAVAQNDARVPNGTLESIDHLDRIVAIFSAR